MIWAYSFCDVLVFVPSLVLVSSSTYGSVLGGLGLATLECDAVALVLETLGGDQTLDARGLGVGLGTLLLGLDLTTDDELADLNHNHVSTG